MQNYFLIVPLSCLCFLAYNTISYWKHKQTVPFPQHNSTKNLLIYSFVLLLVLFFQAWNIYNFITDAFSYNIVYQYSERVIPWFYKITSSFSNKTGAFLLWLTCIACVGFGFVLHLQKILPSSKLLYLLQASATIMPLLLSFMLFFSDAFAQTNADIVPNDGIGFKPILYNKYNLFHAPLLFIGFAFYYYVYIIAICNLFKFQNMPAESNEICIKLLVKYNNYGLLFLFCGVLLGSVWAYNSFGWGGFWNWDIIENAALIPLLLSFAILISSRSLLSGKRKIILLLSVLIFPLILFCTFLARGGGALASAVQSIHSYAPTNHIELLCILGFLLLLLFASIILFIAKFRNKKMKNEKQKFRLLQTKIDKKTIELFEIIVLLCIAFVVLVGTCLPLFAGLLDAKAPILDSTFYLTWIMPLVAVLLILNSIATISNIKFKRSVRIAFPLVFAFLVTLFTYIYFVLFLLDLLLIFACSLSIFAHFQALFECLKKKDITKFGTILVNVGVAMFILATVLQSHFTLEDKIILKEKQKVQTELGFYCVLGKMEKINYHNNNAKWIANISVWFENKKIELNPYFILTSNNLIIHRAPACVLANITDIHIQPLVCYLDNNELILIASIISKPFMIFFWIGNLIIISGFLFFLFDVKKNR